MKIFWSWQSDHPEEVSRYFVRNALENAIKSLDDDLEILEPDRQGISNYYRKDVLGLPDLDNITIENIESCEVFVADVTPVGISEARVQNTNQTKLMNSNVALELGYSLGSSGDHGLIMIMNRTYGSYQDLPFDLQHKAEPIFYTLRPNASKTEIDQELKKLSAKLKAVLSKILPVLRTSSPSFQKHPSIQGDPGRYFETQKPLVARTRNYSYQPVEYFVPDKALYYLRIIPQHNTEKLYHSEAVELIKQGPYYLYPFDHNCSGTYYEANEYGAIAFETSHEEKFITSAAQLFLSREIWAFGNNYLSTMSSGINRIGLPSSAFERNFANMLPRYLEFMREKCRVDPPYTIEAGITGVKGYYIFMRDKVLLGPTLLDNIVWSGRIDSLKPHIINQTLLSIFRAVYDSAAKEQPDDLRGFPGGTARTIPERIKSKLFTYHE